MKNNKKVMIGVGSTDGMLEVYSDKYITEITRVVNEIVSKVCDDTTREMFQKVIESEFSEIPDVAKETAQRHLCISKIGAMLLLEDIGKLFLDVSLTIAKSVKEMKLPVEFTNKTMDLISEHLEKRVKDGGSITE